jgi:hypothetical protein
MWDQQLASFAEISFFLRLGFSRAVKGTRIKAGFSSRERKLQKWISITAKSAQALS